jgi:acyl-CoA thioesterase-1
MTAVVSRLIIAAAALCVAAGWGASHEVLAEERTMKIVVLGDSLTAGYGLPPADAFPAKLEQALRGKGLAATIVNAGVSGDTAAMGLARLDRSIAKDTKAVIVELGANDMLMGFAPDATRAALAEILQKLKVRGVAVLLCGVRTEPAYGVEYERAFAAMFSALAGENDVLFYPAFDDAFVDNARLKLPDGLHPTAAGVEEVVNRILPKVEALIDLAQRKDH